MEGAIPYRYTARIPTNLNRQNNVGPTREIGPIRSPIGVKKLVKENAVIVFARRGCCMSLVVKRLLQVLGANSATYEVEEGCEDDVTSELRDAEACGGGTVGVEQFPVVFIGGRWFGGLDRVMATHITGELTPLLKQAGALWL